MPRHSDISETDLQKFLSLQKESQQILDNYRGRLTSSEVRIRSLLAVIHSEMMENLYGLRLKEDSVDGQSEPHFSVKGV